MCTLSPLPCLIGTIIYCQPDFHVVVDGGAFFVWWVLGWLRGVVDMVISGALT